RLLRPAPRRRVLVAAGSRDAAVGTLRGGQELLASPQPRPRLLHGGQGSTRRQDRGDLGRPPARAALLSRAARRRARTGLRHTCLSPTPGSGEWHCPPRHQGQPRSAPATGVPASIRAGRPSNIDATALPTHGGHPITIVVADDTRFVEHLGNAGRPHPATSRAITSQNRLLRKRSQPSRDNTALTTAPH